MLTPAAAQFVGPLTFGALSRHPVETDVLGLLPDQRIGHIVVADAADALRGRAGHRPLAGRDGERDRERHGDGRLPRDERAGGGRAGHGRRHVDAPGDARQRRAARAGLRLPDRAAGDRVARVRPVRHRAARGPAAHRGRGGGRDRGPARPPARRRGATARHRARVEPDLEGRHVVVSAGGTAEAIDPVRFIGNRSTGRMGVAIAEAALARGARVTIVAGRVEVPMPRGAAVVRAESTAADARRRHRRRHRPPRRRPRHGRRRRRLPPAGAPRTPSSPAARA